MDTQLNRDLLADLLDSLPRYIVEVEGNRRDGWEPVLTRSPYGDVVKVEDLEALVK